MSTKRLEAPAEWRDDIDGWLDSLKAAGYSAETLRTRRCKMTRVASALGGSPGDVSGDALVRWCARQKWKPETRKGYRNTLTSFYAWYRLRHGGGEDPAAALPKVRRPRPHPRPCPDSAIRAALAKATDDEALMILLAAECGLRRGEIAKVRGDDVIDDFVGRSLIVRGKGDKQRIVPIPGPVADAIEARGPGFAFPGRWGGHVEASFVSKHVGRLLPDGYGCHSLRHRYATTLYGATGDIFLVSKLLGHESVETTQIYVALPDSRLRRGMEEVELGT